MSDQYGYDSSYYAGPPIVGSSRPELSNRVSVADPANPRNLIWVEARQDANGNLVPADPRYSVLLGWDGQAATMGSGGGGSSTLAVLGIAAVVIVLLMRGK